MEEIQSDQAQAEQTVLARRFDVYEFSPKSQLPMEGVLVFAGRTGSGKTTAMINILYYYRNKLDVVVAFVGSEETAEKLRCHLPGLNVITEWNDHNSIVLCQI